MDPLTDAAETVLSSWQWCARYQQTLYRSLSADKFDAIDGLTDRELLEIAMRTDYITDYHMLKVVTEQCSVADVVADYIVSTRRKALQMMTSVLEISAPCTSATDLLQKVYTARSSELVSSLLTVADIVKNTRKKM